MTFRLFFSADTGSDGFEPYISDGTALGTFQVVDLNPGAGDGIFQFLPGPDGPAPFMVFYGTDGSDGGEPYVSDGTAQGTFRLADINPGAGDSEAWIRNFFYDDGRVYFAARDANAGSGRGLELYVTDGTSLGTRRLTDLNTGPGDASPSVIGAIDGKILFDASDGTNTNLYAYDPATDAVTTLDTGLASQGRRGIEFNGAFLFAANDGVDGSELWTTDGTAAGTQLLKDINTSGGSFPSAFVEFNGEVYFVADDGTTGQELWKTDGTTGGTVLVSDIFAGAGSSNISSMRVIGDNILFAARDSLGNSELWKVASNGTVSLVKDIRAGGSSSPSGMTEIGATGTAVFSATDDTNGQELWITDGTTAGTQLLKDINPGGTGGSVFNFHKVNDLVFFTANDGTNGRELWVTDGTEAGTEMVEDLTPGAAGTNFDVFAIQDINGAPGTPTLDANTISETAEVDTVVGTVSAVDPDNDSLSFTLTEDAGGRFRIGSNGKIRVDGALDFETNQTHQVTVRATDPDGLFSERTFTLQVLDENEEPVIGALSNASVAERSAKGTDVGTVAVTDPQGDDLTYELTDDAGGRFRITQTGVIKVDGALDFEANASHDVTVRVTDTDGFIDTETFTISVTDVAEDPVIGTLSNKTVDEGAANGTDVGTVSATDPQDEDLTFALTDDAGGRFRINQNGVIKVDGTLDHETDASHNVTVRVTDEEGNTDSKSFSITVGDVDEDPEFNLLFSASVKEDIPVGSVVGTVGAVDPEGGAITYALTDDAGGRFRISATGVVRVKDMLDFETNRNHTITIEARDTAGNRDTTSTTIAVLDVDDLPVLDAVSVFVTPENMPAGAVVATLQASDPQGETVTFTLANNTSRFAINQSGEIRLVGSLDYETDSSHRIRVQLTDPTGNKVTESITIPVSDAAEPTEGHDVLAGTFLGDRIDALGGNDVVRGFAANDVLIGNKGDDQLFGQAGNDSLEGGKGNDLLVGGIGADEIDGGAGNDTVSFTDAQSRVIADLSNTNPNGGEATGDIYRNVEALLGSNFSDIFGGDAGKNRILGFAGNDAIDGRDGKDTILGGAGNDSLYGGKGDDALEGGAGQDELHGGEGDDRLDGSAGIDQLFGGTGNDTLFYTVGDTIDGQAGNDQLVFSGSGVNVDLTQKTAGTIRSVESILGTAGNDEITDDDAARTIQGANGNDTLDGQGGDDILLGGKGKDRLIGGAGNDEISGDAGKDRIAAGLGNDIITLGLDGDRIDGGDGIDTLDASGVSAKTYIDLKEQAAGVDGKRSSESVSAIENVIGSDQADRIFGSDGANRIEGGAGNDIIHGLGGDDVIDGGTGRDELIGGKGDDTVLIRGDEKSADGDKGTDTLSGAKAERALKIDHENGIYRGDDTVKMTGFERFVGSRFDDTITGKQEFDDHIAGGRGADKIDGLSGLDTADYSASSKGVDVDLGRKTQKGGDAAGDRLTSIENLVGSAGNDTLSGGSDNTANMIDGGAGNDRISGGKGDDTLSGGLGKDRLDGRASGDDRMNGGDGADVLLAKDGLDRMFGDGGNDTLIFGAGDGDAADIGTGGAGSDTFVIRKGSDAEITDFTEVDRLDLSDFGFASTEGVRALTIDTPFGLFINLLEFDTQVVYLRGYDLESLTDATLIL
ncbi:hypothetical protein CVM52_01100 [Pseudooceanicola lipolyticus]|uniref:Cadherin domain-containing protein n=1 Tax=Pseudooceanicola lipolyticus TaxID=2029104 RepID=A0A2M8J7K1_9RHOB|nr:ELWxxDGT repeat protein [Pseudooceanicola lipolyticus]PJE38752.1 hypothetical protein CVM52_01100 [Pseudooceanicola lipolyticus]